MRRRSIAPWLLCAVACTGAKTNTLDSLDADDDGVVASLDCDDQDASLGSTAADADCDGAITAADCDDADPAVGALASDSDCDGVPTAEDCDDDDDASTIVAQDADCDGILTADDCDDDDDRSTAIDEDADCDGVTTFDDCDDEDARSTAVSEDADCDGVRTADDCDDRDRRNQFRPDDPRCNPDLAPTWNTAAWTTDWRDAIDCGSSGRVTFTAETNNWGFDAQLFMTSTRFLGSFQAWSELHTMSESNASANNDGTGFSIYERTLNTSVTVSTQSSDVSTVFGCGSSVSLNPSDSANFQATFALALWAEGDDAGTDDPADCIVFGQDPTGLLANPTGNSRWIPAWFSAASCRNVNP